jgi:glutamate N-acetyltransferase/amino-acid N-acetyltransferase
VIARAHLARAEPRYLLINSGNANAGTGANGLRDARTTCEIVAAEAGVTAEEVLPFSTGVIGQPLPVDRIRAAVPQAFSALNAEGWADAARAIMTTDTLPKAISKSISLDGHTVTLSGIAKGAGMIRPDMATMLAFLATDAAVEPVLLQRMLAAAISRSFNRITVDGDTSTNDACVLAATGRSHAAPIRLASRAADAMQAALDEVSGFLAEAIVRDGEGATKFVRIVVAGGHSREECLTVAYTIAHSPLVKTAFFAADANWGRILAAIGRAGVEGLDVNRISIDLNGVRTVEHGGRAAAYTEEAGTAAMQPTDITVTINLDRGSACETVMTCDLSFDYVRINAEYRT